MKQVDITKFFAEYESICEKEKEVVKEVDVAFANTVLSDKELEACKNFVLENRTAQLKNTKAFYEQFIVEVEETETEIEAETELVE